MERLPRRAQEEGSFTLFIRGGRRASYEEKPVLGHDVVLKATAYAIAENGVFLKVPPQGATTLGGRLNCPGGWILISAKSSSEAKKLKPVPASGARFGSLQEPLLVEGTVERV